MSNTKRTQILLLVVLAVFIVSMIVRARNSGRGYDEDDPPAWLESLGSLGAPFEKRLAVHDLTVDGKDFPRPLALSSSSKSYVVSRSDTRIRKAVFEIDASGIAATQVRISYQPDDDEEVAGERPDEQRWPLDFKGRRDAEQVVFLVYPKGGTFSFSITGSSGSARITLLE